MNNTNYNLNEWINPEYLNKEKQKEINSNYLNSTPYEHFFLDNFLREDKINEIIVALKYEKYYLEDSDLYQFLRTHDFSNSKNNRVIYEFRNFLLSSEFRGFLEKLTSSKIVEDKISVHSLNFKKTNYLLCHDDVVDNRQFAFIFNLTKNWKNGDGGEFDMFLSNETGDVLPEFSQSVEPIFNRFYLFKVQRTSYHQVSEVVSEIDRLTIGGWYY